ncbi:tRNA pseudouridine(13) synthase TruD [Nanoarchaeota archaeon]
MYKIKQIPEDFRVNELFSLTEKITSQILTAETPFSYFRMEKTNFTTMKAIDMIARKLRMPRKKIGFAGNKDKKAVTKQNISIRYGKKDLIENLNIRDIELTFLGCSSEPISLGDLNGNSFKITIRNLTKTQKPQIKEKMINYFGEQRFSKNNVKIGKYIIKKDFKKAVDLLRKNEREFQVRIYEYMKQNPRDYVGALRLFQLKILKLYVHSYQSDLWNKMADKYLEKNKEPKNIKIPLIGFHSRLENPDMKFIIRNMMKKEEITPRDFIIRQIPDLSSAGDYRQLFVSIKDLKISKPQEDDINKDKFKYIIRFSLTKGSYATEAIKVIFS